MTFAGDGGLQALLHRPGPAQDLGASVLTVLAPPGATAGRYSLYRFDLSPRSGGPGPHVHRTFAESFSVLSGQVELFDGERWFEAEPGDHLFVPEGVVHAFRHTRDEPASILMLSAPAVPREDYFAELQELLQRPGVTMEDLLELWARHVTYPPPDDHDQLGVLDRRRHPQHPAAVSTPAMHSASSTWSAGSPGRVTPRRQPGAGSASPGYAPG